MGYGYSVAEQKRRREEWAAAPKKCPHCQQPINQHFREYDNDEPRQHCGSTNCRAAAYRQRKLQRRDTARKDARAAILQYCNERMTATQRQSVMNMTDMLMQFSIDEGHQIALEVVEVIKTLTCKHDRIAELEQNAVLWQRRALASERQSKERITELEAELELFNNLHNSIHAIAQGQLQKQPDPPTQPLPPEPKQLREEEDRAHVLAQLRAAGIRPIEEALADEEEEAAAGEDEYDSDLEEEEEDDSEE